MRDFYDGVTRPDDEWPVADPGDPPLDYDPLAEILHRRLTAKEQFVGPRKPSTISPGIEAWIERGMAGMELMATNEAERLKVARRLF